MNADLMVYLVVIALVGFLLAQLRVTKRMLQYLATLLKATGTAHYDPWRCRLAGLILVCPIVPSILEVGDQYIDRQFYIFEGPSGAVLAFAEILAYVRVLADPLFVAAWLGLIAYGVLRRPYSGKVRLIFAILGYWIGASLIFGILFLPITVSFSFVVDSAQFFTVVLTLAMVSCLFWLVARGTRLQLAETDEIVEAEGLSLRDLILGVSVIGLLYWLIYILTPFIVSQSRVVLINDALLLLLLSKSAIMLTSMLVIAFLSKTKLQILFGVVLLGLLETGSLVLMFFLVKLPEDVTTIGSIGGGSEVGLFVQSFISLATIMCALLFLHFIWQTIGFSISVVTLRKR